MTTNLLDTARRDIRFAARSLMRTPLFTVCAVLALALGIGATTAILTVVDAVLLRPLPYADADRLVVVLHDGNDPVAPANFLDWRAQSRAFSAMAAAEFWTPTITGGDDPEHVNGLRMTADMFPMLGVAPLLGRTFSADDERSGADHLAVISYGLWQRRFASKRDVIGQKVSLNGQAFTIIGVMPVSFRFAPFWATRAELWAPLALGERASSRGGQSLRVFGRLRPGVSLTQARLDVAGLTARLEQQFPGTNRNVQVVPLKQKVVGDIRAPLIVLLAAVAFVLLIACANVAHMLLARAATRRREIAVRTALGASRRRLLTQMLTENGLLALAGGATGVLFAVVGVRALVAASPAIIPRVASVSVDGRVLAMAAGITALTILVFGILPAARATRSDIAETFRDGGRSTSGGRRQSRLRSALVASEFALALVLLTGAGLMARSFMALQRVDPGFDPRGVLTMTVATVGTPAADSSRHAAFYSAMLERVSTLPGVESASLINHVPIAGDNWGFPFRVEGREKPPQGDWPSATYRVTVPGYFRTMHLPLVRGRDFTDADRADASPVVIVNDFMARKHWPNENPIGHRITLDDSTWVTVVGVAKNAVRDQWSAPPREEMYLPFFQQHAYAIGGGPRGYMSLVVRARCSTSDCDAQRIAPDVRAAIRAIEPHAPISEVATMQTIVDGATAEPRFFLFLLAVFAGVAVTLAAVGLYGVTSYGVAQRTHEIGIRLALGAEPSSVLMSVVGDGARLAMVGSVAGLVIALISTRAMRGFLYGVEPSDPLTLVIVTALLCGIAVIAASIPARRATRIDPLQALRSD